MNAVVYEIQAEYRNSLEENDLNHRRGRIS